MLKVTKDRSYREIEVMSDDEDTELSDAQARTFAEQYLCDEGTDCDWEFDGSTRVNSQRVIVQFVGW